MKAVPWLLKDDIQRQTPRSPGMGLKRRRNRRPRAGKGGRGGNTVRGRKREAERGKGDRRQAGERAEGPE